MAIEKNKYESKRKLLILRTSLALGVSQEESETLLSIPRQQSLRCNPLVQPIEESRRELGVLGATILPVPWLAEGCFLTSTLETVRDSELVKSGAVYIQNAASWLPIIALNPLPNEYILDMCAAPGGKTSHVAARSNNQAYITANDNSRPRLHKLQANLERLNVKNTTYTLHDATHLTKHVAAESFDKILLDAPCSGEGMMNCNTPKDFESWSVAHIKRLQQLQKKLIVQAWQLLKPGGTLVYSTCTMAPDENEAVVDYLLRRFDSARIEPLDALKAQLPNAVGSVTEWNNKAYHPDVAHSLRLGPSSTIEAFFVAKLTKAVSTNI